MEKALKPLIREVSDVMVQEEIPKWELLPDGSPIPEDREWGAGAGRSRTERKDSYGYII